jgi:hypothetical protein
MAKKNPAAVALGKIGGRSTSAAKAEAARKNGQKGGRPKKSSVKRSMCVAAVVSFLSCAPASAQPIADLEARIAALEARLAATDAPRVQWDGPNPIHQLGGMCGTQQYCLGTASVVRQETGSPNGGPQALEGYSVVNNPAGSVVRHASGTIGNLEIAGAGAVTIARSLTTGLVFSGSGRVKHASTLNLFVGRKAGYTGPVNVERLDFITFPNGWSLRGPLDGSYMILVDQHGRTVEQW